MQMAYVLEREMSKKVLCALALLLVCSHHAFASRTDLLQNVISTRQHPLHPSPNTNDRVLPDNEEELKARSRLIMPRDYPFNDNDCKENWWTFGAPGKLIKTVANHVGIHRCINYPRDAKNLVLIYLQGDFIGNPMYLMQSYPGSLYNLTQLYPHLRDDLCVSVHRIPPKRLSITRSFLHDTWVATGTTLMMAAGAMHLAGMRPAWFHALAIFITGGFPESHSSRSVVSTATRSALCLLLSILSLILTNAFTGMFMTFLTVPQHTQQINTIAELLARVDKVWMDASVYYLLKGTKNDEVAQKIFNLSYVYDDLDYEPFHGFLQNPSDAFIQSERILNQMLLLHSFVGKDGHPLTRMMSECLISPGFLAFPVKTHWYFKDRFDALVQRLVHAGIVDKMERDAREEWRYYMNTWKKENKISSPPPPTAGDASGPEPLNLQAMWEPGALLGLGLALATVALLAELLAGPRGLWARRHLWRKRPLCVWRSAPKR